MKLFNRQFSSLLYKRTTQFMCEYWCIASILWGHGKCYGNIQQYMYHYHFSTYQATRMMDSLIYQKEKEKSEPL